MTKHGDYYALIDYGRAGVVAVRKRVGPFPTVRAAHAHMDGLYGAPVASDPSQGIQGYRVIDGTGTEHVAQPSSR